MAEITDNTPGMMRAARNAPFLSRDEEWQLASRWKEQRDEASLHRLTMAHMRLVMAIAARFRRYGLSMQDLVQEGHIGLMEAAARFDPERDVRFSTYATWWIRAAIQDHVLRNWSIVRGGTSSAQKTLFFNLRRLRARLDRDDAVSSADAHAFIAGQLGIKVADVALMDARLSGPDLSLNAPAIDSDSVSAERGDFVPDSSPLPDETVGERIDGERYRQWLRAAMKVLNERELKILKARRLASEAVTLEALGSRLGISKERVRQIENRAMEKLQRVLAERHPHMRAGFGA